MKLLVSLNISEWNSFTILLSFNFQSLTFFLCLFVTDTYTTNQWQDTKNIYGNIISGFINSYPVRVFNGRNLYISSNIKILPFFEVKWSKKQIQDEYVWGTVSNAWSKCRFVFQLRVKPVNCLQFELNNLVKHILLNTSVFTKHKESFELKNVSRRKNSCTCWSSVLNLWNNFPWLLRAYKAEMFYLNWCATCCIT